MWLTRTLLRGAYVLLGLLVVCALAVFATQTAAFRNWARGQAEQQATRLVNGDVTIGKLDGNLFTGAELTSVTIRQDGREIITIERATARYDLRRLLSTDLALTNVTLMRPAIVLVHNRDGWRIASLLRRRPESPASTRTFAIESLTVEDGTVVVDDSAPEGEGTPLPDRVDGLRATLALTGGGGRIGLDFARASFRTDAPAIDVRSLTGRLVNGTGALQLDQFRIRTAHSAVDLDGRYQGGDGPHLVQATVRASPLYVDEFATYLPTLAGRSLSPTFTVSLDGPFEALEVNGTVTEPTIGSIRSEVTVNARAPIRAVRGAVTVDRLNLAPLLDNHALVSDLTAKASVNLTIAMPVSLDTVAGQVVMHSRRSELAGYRYDAIDGTVAVKGRQFTIATDARAYGAAGRVSGTIAARDGGVAYNLRGLVRDVDLRRLPSRLRIPPLESNVAGAYTAVGVGSSVDGTLEFDASTVEGATIDAGSRGRISLAGEVPRYGFDGRVVELDVRRVGRALGIQGLGEDRFASRLAGRVALDGTGRDLGTLRLDLTTELEPSSLFNASLRSASIHARIEDRQVTASALGEFASLNLAALTGRERLQGEVAGTFDVRTAIADLGQPVTLDSVSADGSVHLGASTIGPVTFDTAVLEGRYANRGGHVTSLSILGPELDITASGPIALGDGGESQLTYQVVHGRLEDISSLFGRDVAGRLRIQGTMTGNGSRLASKGTSTLAPLQVGTTFDALEVESTFEASLEDLRVDSLRATADIESILLTVAGRKLRSLTAKVAYASSELQFQSTVREEGRTATATGRLLTLPDAREVRVEQLAIEAAGVTWSSIPGQGFIAHYGSNGLLTLDAVVLTSGSQRLITEGSVSLQPNVDGMLDVRVEQVDVAGLGTLLLVQRTLGGVLDGSGRVTGDSEHRVMTGRLAVANGLVDGFRFESLDASVRTTFGRVGIEAVLRQASGAELTIAGELATSAEGAAADEPLDLSINSDGIDLGLLDAASTAIDDATGRLVVDLHVGGTAAAPRMEGFVNVQNGAFTVASTRTQYAGAMLDVLFEGDRLRIGALRLLDDNGGLLEGSGTLRLEGRRLQEVDLTIEADEFKVLNNDLGELSVDTTLNIYGTLLSPKIAGLVRLRAGRLEVDALVDRFTSSAYAIAPDEPTPDQNVAAAEPAGPSFDVTVQVPGNLVLRGRDIRPADAAVALGDLNVTVGGDFIIRGQPGDGPVLLGTVTAVRGSYSFQGRRFELLRDGTIAFRGERPIDPSLDLQAERVISGIVAHVSIDGTMRSPSLMLSSRPPLDEGDILSLILFNQPVNRIGETERVALGERAVGLASGFVVSSVSDTVEHALDLDVFELEAITDDGGGPAVTFGEQVGERLFVRFRQIFGTQEASEFQLEYEVADFLRLQGSLSEGKGRTNRSLTRRVERGGVDLVVFFSY